jgi:polar amino acid transport system substrate-binding protein
MRTRRLLPIAVLVAGLGAAGCVSASNAALNHALPPLQPPPTTIPATTTTTKPTPCDPTASLRPSGPLPAVGADLSAYPTVQDIVKRGRLIAGVDQNTLLFGYRDPITGQLGGFDIDVVRAIARAIFGTDEGRVQYKTVTTGQRQGAVQNKDVDIVVSEFTENCAREQGDQAIDFSSVYYLGYQEVLVRKDAPIKTVADLAHKTVCALQGSTSIDNIKKVVPKVKIYPVAARTDCLVALQQGLADAITSDDTILAGFVAQDPDDVRILQAPDGGPARLENEPYGVGVNQGQPDLVRYVNAVLEQMRADGELSAIAQNWLHDQASPIPAANYKD